MSKISILDLKKKGHFFQILLYVQSPANLASQGLTFLYALIYYILKWILEICIKKWFS